MHIYCDSRRRADPIKTPFNNLDFGRQKGIVYLQSTNLSQNMETIRGKLLLKINLIHGNGSLLDQSVYVHKF